SFSRLSRDRTLGANADAAGGDHELAVLVAVLGDVLREHELPGAPFLLPAITGTRRRGEHITGANVTVVLEVLLRVQPPAHGGASRTTSGAPTGAPTRRLPPDAGRLPAGTEPGLADL